MAISLGISQDRFWSMTPKMINIQMEGYNLQKKREMDDNNTLAFIQGSYFLEAMMVIASSFGKGKKHEYPKEPYKLWGETKELTEEEKIEKTKALFASLEIMATNFNNNKKKENTMDASDS